LNEIEDVTVVWVSDLRPGRREFIKQRYPSVNVTANASEVLSDPSVDAVVIATPPDTHCKLALDALAQGKHLLVEKPLATTSVDAEKIVEAATRFHRTLAVGHLFLYSPAIRQIKSLLDAGEIGTIFSISSVRSNLGPPNTQIDALWDLAPHDLSMILYLFDDLPSDVNAYAASFTNQRFAEVVFCTLRFADGRIANVHVSWLTPAKTRLMQIIGSKRVVAYDDMQPTHKVQVFDPGIDNRVAAGERGAGTLTFSPGGVWMPPLDNTEPLRQECIDFISCIRSGKAPLSSGVRALGVVRTLEMASTCLRQGGRSIYRAHSPTNQNLEVSI
jgi:predicted dehydrogenase